MRPTFQVEPFSTAWPDAQELLRLHWGEIALDRDTVPLAPAVHQYEHLEAIDQLLVVTMRIAGELVGYYATFVKPHLHYETTIMGFTDLFYIHPLHRRGFNAIGLFHAVDTELHRRGAKRWYANCKLSLDLLPLFKRLGFTEIERGFAKLPEAH